MIGSVGAEDVMAPEVGLLVKLSSNDFREGLVDGGYFKIGVRKTLVFLGILEGGALPSLS